ncbi:hypothetical protein PSP6_660011 [Paraburkholderia tropica]|nr:hypothetical protein PSP6_660011 [Paraburkholderia tropica]
MIQNERFRKAASFVFIGQQPAMKGHSGLLPTSSTIDRQHGLAEPSRQLVALIGRTTIGKEGVSGRTANVDPFCTMEVRW